MPTIKVKQNGVWKVISTAGNNSNVKDYSTVVITYDSSTMLASLNSLDIFNLALEGRNIVLNSDEIIYPLIEATENLISFAVTTIGDDISGTVYITIDNNKQVTKIINKGITVPVPTKKDTNKILSVGTDNNAQWIDIPSGSGSSSVYIQDEEPENASVGSLWLDTDEENDRFNVPSAEGVEF
jgi:hypothetical protein